MIKNGIQKKKLLAILACVLLCGACIVAYTDAQGGRKSKEDKLEQNKVVEDKLTDTQEPSEEEGNNVPVREAEYKITDIWGADQPRIYYEDDSRMIFAGYFGLFVYSKPEQQIVQSLDLKYIGCDDTQGDHYCDIQVAADGTQVYLHVNNDTTMYQYSVDTNQLRHVKYDLPEKLYNRGDGDEEKQSWICVGAGTIGDLSYEYADANGEYMHRVPLFYTPYAPYASCEFFGPKDMHDICEVSFYLCGKEYVIKDGEKLEWIEEHFQSPTEEIKGGAGCPFYHVMYLKRDDGTCGKIYPATDSCAVFGTRGEGTDEYAYYEYDEGTNDVFWKLFGIDSIGKAGVGGNQLGNIEEGDYKNAISDDEINDLIKIITEYYQKKASWEIIDCHIADNEHSLYQLYTDYELGNIIVFEVHTTDNPSGLYRAIVLGRKKDNTKWEVLNEGV